MQGQGIHSAHHKFTAYVDCIYVCTYFRAILYKSLFMANEILQGCLVHVRKLCESASGSLTGLGEGEHAISLVSLDKSQTLTLEDFMSIQAQQGDKALKQLNALRDKIINLVWESCAVSWSAVSEFVQKKETCCKLVLKLYNIHVDTSMNFPEKGI